MSKLLFKDPLVEIEVIEETLFMSGYGLAQDWDDIDAPDQDLFD